MDMMKAQYTEENVWQIIRAGVGCFVVNRGHKGMLCVQQRCRSRR